jgi:hypothetical protein
LVFGHLESATEEWTVAGSYWKIGTIHILEGYDHLLFVLALLLMFNVGVETGQILFVIVVLLLMAAFRRMPVSWPQGSWRLMPYAIGSIAAFWTVERVAAFI